MPVQQFKEAGEVVHLHDLAKSNSHLDLTSERWNLNDGQASRLIGVDVTALGSFRTDRQRIPLNTGLSRPRGSITDAWSITLSGLAVTRHHYRADTQIYRAGLLLGYVLTATSLQKRPAEYTRSGPWPSGILGSMLVENGDARVAAREIRRISGISKTTSVNDTITWEVALTSAGVTETKWYIVSTEPANLSGILMTDGRRFWLLQNGVSGVYLDLGSDTYLGERWSAVRISTRMVLLVNDKYPSRVLRLGESFVSEPLSNATLAGMITPVKPRDIEPPQIDGGGSDNSWYANGKTGGALTPSSTYRCRIRAVNLEDGAESRLVDVYDEDDTDDIDIDLGAGDNAITVFTKPDDSGGATPPLHERWTHIEVWRTTNGGTTYYLESRIEVNPLFSRWASEGRAQPDTLVIANPPNGVYPILISDTLIPGFNAGIMSATDVLAGYHPPMCRRSVSLFGVTLCLGSSSEVRHNPSIKSMHVTFIDADYDDTGHVSGEHAIVEVGAFTNYTFKDGDSLVVIIPLSHAGEYVIASRASADVILLEDSIGTDATGTVSAWVNRPYEIDWPFIESDEDVWYSRTDKFAPESFLTRTLKLSDIGDVFMSAVNVGNYVAVIMREGVHLLYLSGTSLIRDTIAPSAEGTPWERSVIVVGNLVIWATAEGPKMMAVSNSANQDGHRGAIQLVSGLAEATRAWFREASDLGYTVDAGVDSVNSCIRFRRKESENTFQVLQWNYRYNVWTMLDGDNGVVYVNSADAEAGSRALLYSVTKEGGVFRLNDDDDPYPGLAVEGTLDDTFQTVSEKKLRKAGAFSATMLGDVIWFRTPGQLDGGTQRVIRTATVDEITFDTVVGLSRGHSFYIGPIHFRYKPAPLMGTSALNGLTLESVHLRARRVSPGDVDIAVRAYEDYADNPVQGEEKTIALLDPGQISADREAGIEATGTAVEIELESLSSDAAFTIEQLSARVREQADVYPDTSKEE